MGDELLFVKDVGWDMRSPCNDCPFLRTSPYHGGVAASLEKYHRSIMDHEFAHTCHKTDSRPAVDGPRTHQGQPQHCAGALMMLAKTGNGLDLQLPLLRAMETGKLSTADYADLARRAKKDARVFTIPGLLSFYTQKLEMKLASVGRKLLRKAKKAKRRK